MAAPVFNTNDVPDADQINDWFVNVNWKRKLTDTDRTNNVTMANDTELSVPVEANAVYLVNSTLIWHASSQSAGDWKYQFTAPSGSVLSAGVSCPDWTATTNNGDLVTGLSLNTAISGGIIATADPWNPAITDGVLVVGSTAGSFTLQWAQNSSSATITRLKANSFICLRRVE